MKAAEKAARELANATGRTVVIMGVEKMPSTDMPDIYDAAAMKGYFADFAGCFSNPIYVEPEQ